MFLIQFFKASSLKKVSKLTLIVRVQGIYEKMSLKGG